MRYCEFGGSLGLREMDSAKFAKVMRDCGLVDRRLNPADVDLIFTMSKTKGLRRLQFEQFVDALHRVASKKYPDLSSAASFERLEDAILSSGAPALSGTVAVADGVFSKLTDASLYTGAHKERFDESGRGLGLEGRDGGRHGPIGKVGDLSQITRTNLNH